MSTKSVRDNLGDELLRLALVSEGEMIRNTASIRPQVINLQDLEWLDNIILEMMDRKSSKLDKKRFRRYNDSKGKNLAKARKLAKVKHDRWMAGNKLPGSAGTHILHTHVGQRLHRDAPDLYNLILKGEAFVVGSFATAGSLKKEIITALVTRKSHINFVETIIGNVDRGHGAGTGQAIATISASRAVNAVAEVLTPEQKKEFDAYVLEQANGLIKSGQIDNAHLSMITGILMEYSTSVDKQGNLRAEYIPALQFQDKYTNRAVDAPREKFVKDLMFKFAANFNTDVLINMKGSDSIKTQVAKTVLAPMVSLGKKHKNIIVELESQFKGSIKSGKGKVSSKSKKSGKTNVRRNRAAKGLKLTKNKTAAFNPLALLGVLNQKLPEIVRKNMSSPALVNRTGRFADSVKVVDMNRTPQGFASIGYTYDRQPYGVFEMGGGAAPWATPERDPRQLIDKSIREIAMQFAIGRFYTRRL